MKAVRLYAANLAALARGGRLVAPLRAANPLTDPRRVFWKLLDDFQRAAGTREEFRKR